MNKGRKLLTLTIAIGLSATMILNIKNLYSPFQLISEKKIEEINSIVHLMKHKKTGARVIYLENDDENKVFSIGFRTPPKDDTGATHILEHSVLCGSAKYPVKDPFLIMSKQSLNTFLNAITYPDMTIYPVASKNVQDFKNLMSVYCDAVFFPNIIKNEKIFMQEGWHYELENDLLVENGVVLNEMKGAHGAPEERLYHSIKQALFPDNAYAYNSGGDPEKITTLTQEAFINLYQEYYHPSNSYIYLYGNLDLEETLGFLDKEYLSKFEKNIVDTAISMQEPFQKGVEIQLEYPVSAKNKTAKSYMALAYTMDTILNKERMLEIDILNDLLMSTSAAPLRRALLEADLADNVYSEFDTTLRQPVFSILCENAEASKQAEFEKIVKEALENILVTGFDEKLVQATIHSYEMNLREVNAAADRGLTFQEDIMKAWIHDGNPISYLEIESFVEKLKQNINPFYFNDIIKTMYLENNHKALIVMNPVQGLEEEMQTEEKEELAEKKRQLSAAQLQEVKDKAEALTLWQNTEDSKANIEKLPCLSIDEVDKKQEIIPNERKVIADVDVLVHDIYTNGLVYMDFYFDTRSVPQEDLMYLFLLDSILGSMSTENYHYEELANELGIYTGDFDFSIKNNSNYKDHTEIKPFLNVSAFATDEKVDKTMELVEEIINHTSFADKKRLHALIKETKSDMKSFITDNGTKLATRRALSYISPVEAYNDLAFLPYYNFICQLDKDFNKEYKAVVQKLMDMTTLIFTKENLTIGVTLEEQQLKGVETSIHKLSQKLSNAELQKHTYTFPKQVKNEGLILTGKVNYVAQAYNIEELGFQFNGKMRVLQNIIESEYLWQNVRVKGGAYGAYMELNANGNMAFLSYRDPNIKQTLETYQGLVSFIENFQADEKEMTNLIIGTIGQIDGLKSPWAKGKSADRMAMTGITSADLQRLRQEILNTTVEDIRGFAPMLKEVLAQNCYVVVGSKSKLKQNETIFQSISEILK